MQKVFIVAAKRSPIGSFLGAFNVIKLKDISSQVITDLIKQAKVGKPVIDQLIVGNVLSSGLGQNLARQLVFLNGLSDSCISYMVNMLCGSGLKSVLLGYDAIRLGEADLVIAGGVEHMSNAPFLVDANYRKDKSISDKNLSDTILCDGLIDPTLNSHMGQISEQLAIDFNITKKDQDKFAKQSFTRYEMALNADKFKDEITPIKSQNGIIDADEFSKKTFSDEKIASLKTPFKEGGTITAANASSYADGVSFVMLASEKAVKEHNLVVLAEIITTAQVGIDANSMGLAPVKAIKTVLEKLNPKATLQDIDKLAITEAFSVQIIAVVKQLAKNYQTTEEKIYDILNVNGGAVALGHPIGASANSILVSLIYELKAKQLGLASACIGGGLGVGIIIKKV